MGLNDRPIADYKGGIVDTGHSSTNTGRITVGTAQKTAEFTRTKLGGDQRAAYSQPIY
jgi:hypothetical protein